MNQNTKKIVALTIAGMMVLSAFFTVISIFQSFKHMKKDDSMEKKERIYCKRCKYFYITWDTRFPNGCKLFNIKTKYMPSALVYQSTGQNCVQYEEKRQ